MAKNKPQNLLRNSKSGRYYVRWTISGKQKWVALDTDVFSVAKLRLNDEAAKIEKQRGSNAAVSSGSGTVGDLMAVYEESTKRESREQGGELAPATISARIVALKKVRKTWPELAGLKPVRVTPEAVIEWVTRFKEAGTKFTPPGSQTLIAGNSATSVNGAIDTVRRLMDLALESGAIHSNPVGVAARSLKNQGRSKLKRKVLKSELILPSTSDVQQLLAAMENNGARGGWGDGSGGLLPFSVLLRLPNR